MANTVSTFHAGTYPAGPPPVTSLSQLAELLQSADDPLHAAVEIVARQTKARGAFLYVLSGQDLQLSRSSTDREPPPECVGELARWVELVRENDPTHRTGDGRDVLVVDTVTVSGYRLVALQSPTERTIVGGLILQAEPTVDMVGCTELFDALGGVVEEHGADALGFITA